MNFRAGPREFLGTRVGPFSRAPSPREPAPATPCAICLEKVVPGGWSSEPVPTCRLCWPLLAWFRGLYADSESPGLIAQFNAETRFDELGTDSLDYIEFAIEAEEAFGITLPDRDAERILTVGDFLRYIRDCLHHGDGKPFRPTPTETGKLWDRDLDG